MTARADRVRPALLLSLQADHLTMVAARSFGEPRGGHTRNMCRAVTVLVLAVVALIAASAASSEVPIATAAACSGRVDEQINGKMIRARSISTRRTGCANGRGLLRSFLDKADRSESCNRASKQPPPTSGCSVRGFNCFRNGSTYCASPGGRSVMWKE